MRIHKILLLVALCNIPVISTAQQTQGNLAPTQQEVVTIKPRLALGDVKAVANFLGGIDIRGNEVDAFLDVKKSLTDAAEKAAKDGKKDEEGIQVPLRMDVANNLFLLMQRASLKGAEAEKFKEIISAIQEAARDSQKK